MRAPLIDALLYACAHLCFLGCTFPNARCQRGPESRPAGERGPAAPGPLRRTIQWQHDGRLFSILSQGAQYVPPVRRGGEQQPRHQSPVAVVSSGLVRDNAAPASSETGQNSGTGRAPTPSRTGLRRLPIRRPGAPRSRVNETESANVSPSPPPPRAREDGMIGDDPYNPYKYSDPENPYYNYYDAYEQPRPRQRPGYGTRYFQNGKIMI